MRIYLIDVLVRGTAGDCPVGEEPIIAATRVAVEAPEAMDSTRMAKALGEEVKKIGAHFLDNSDQLGTSLDKYEDAARQVKEELSPPESRPN
jgi:hypothetical protein